MTVEIRRILLPTDFSAPAKQAQQYAIELAERFGAQLHLIHVVPQLPLPFPDSNSVWVVPDIDVKSQIEVAKRRLEQEVSTEWASSHSCVSSVEAGFAVDEIVRYATKNDIDLIVVGTHGHTGLNRLLLGSVAEKIVRLAQCPVLTVHPKGHVFASDVDATTRAPGK